MYKLAKPFLLLFLIGSFVVITSCNDGEEGDDFVAAEIAGTWNFNSFDLDATIDGIDFLKWFSDTYGAPESAFQEDFDDLAEEFNEFEGLILQLNEDGTATASQPGEVDDVGTWVLDESSRTLTITFDGEAVVLNVISLTSSAMVGTLTESGDFFDLDQDGIAEVLEVTMTIGLTK